MLRTAAAVVLTLALAVVLVGPGSANQRSTPITVRSAHSQAEVGRSDAAPWTEERFRSAQPAPQATLSVTRQIASPTSETLGTPTVVAASRPGATSRTGAATAAPEPEQVTVLRWYDYPAPFTRYKVKRRDVTKWPLETVGVLFFSQGGVDYRCSAASVARFAVWTAGHCVHDGSGRLGPSHWSKDVVFVPAYDGRKPCPGSGCPFGIWKGDHAWTLWAWAEGGDSQFDMGGVVLKRRSGSSLSETVGALGFAWNHPYVQHWNLFGYPAAQPFNGKLMQTCQASTAGTFGDFFPMIAVGCDMTEGSSGGPFILDFGKGYYINGNVSIYIEGQRKETLTPYFGNCAGALFEALRQSTPGSPADDFECTEP